MPQLEIRAELEDATTDVGQGPFNVTYFDEGVSLTPDVVDRLDQRLSLKTWPEGSPVSRSVLLKSLTPESSSNFPVQPQALVEVHPEAVLEDRWYSLELGPIERGLSITQTFGGGTTGVRLRPGSHPAVRAIHTCQSDPSGAKVIVDFSEKVTLPSPGDALVIAQNGKTLDCRLTWTRPDGLNAFCDDFVAGLATVALAAEQAQGRDGAFVPPGTWTLDPSAALVTMTGCLTYRPAL